MEALPSSRLEGRKVHVLVIDDENHNTDYVHKIYSIPILLICTSARKLATSTTSAMTSVSSSSASTSRGENLIGDRLERVNERWPRCWIILLTNTRAGLHPCGTRIFEGITKAELEIHPDIPRIRLIEAMRESCSIDPCDISRENIPRLQEINDRSPVAPSQEVRVPLMSIRGEVEDPKDSADEVEVLLEEVDGDSDFLQIFMRREMFDSHPGLLVPGAGFDPITFRTASEVVSEVVPGRPMETSARSSTPGTHRSSMSWSRIKRGRRSVNFVSTTTSIEAIHENEGALPLLIHVLDVGHGDSIIVEFPGGDRFGIVDCHAHAGTNRGFEHARPIDQRVPKALTFFRDRQSGGIRCVVEFACLTHPHADHYRGFRRPLEGFDGLGINVSRLWEWCASVKKARALLRAAATRRGPVLIRDADEIQPEYRRPKRPKKAVR